MLVASKRSLLTALLRHIPDSKREGLRDNPVVEIPRAFPPVSLLPMGSRIPGSEECSCDGVYLSPEEGGPFENPYIVYRRDVTPRRIAFTLLHELGHHIARFVDPDLLDLVDGVAGPQGDPEAVEEAACHELAGELLVSKDLLERVVGQGPVTPTHLVELYERGTASWEAAAVRLASKIKGSGAIIFVREAGRVSFCTTSSTLSSRWTRDSLVDPKGPLSKALEGSDSVTAAQDVFRWSLGGAERLWCDIKRISPDFAIAVMTDRPSDGQLNLIEPVAPKWKTRLLFCEKCGGARNRGWCDVCKGRRCEVCDACGCYRQTQGRLCPACHLMKGAGAFDPGEELCRDCR